MSTKKMKKREAPPLYSETADYRITEMYRYDSFMAATILVMETGELLTAHNRYGAWFLGEPAEKNGNMRDLLPEVAAKLQEHKGRWLKDEESRTNPLLGANNPFGLVAVDLTNNPFNR